MNSNLIVDGVLCPNGTNYCSDPMNYPTRSVKKAMRKQKRMFKSMFNPADLYPLRLRTNYCSDPMNYPTR